MRDHDVILEYLEGLLEREEQQYKSLTDQVGLEYQALITGDAQELVPVIEAKEGLLAEILQTEKDRCEVMKDLGQSIGLHSEHASLLELVQHLEASTAERILHFREGILVLADELRYLTNKSRIVAQVNQARLQDLQTFLLDVNIPLRGYEASGAKIQPTSLPSQEIEGWV